MKFILFFVLPLLAICFVLHLLGKRAKRRADSLMKEAEAEERRQAALFTGQHINSLPIIDWEAHRKAQRARASEQSARVEKTRSRRDDDDDIMNPLHPLNPLNPIGLVNSSLNERDNEGTTNIFPGGGGFGGAGSSASWEPSTCHDDSSSRHSSSDSSYSSSDSGSSSSGCD